MSASDDVDRIASHPDDQDASFADRLLLALGIWPHHIAQLGEQVAVDTAAIIRSNAHRYSMVVEDWSTEREQRELLEGIVRDLANAASRPGVHADECKFCGSAGDHTEQCIWSRARFAVAEECEACGGFGDCGRCDGDGCGTEAEDGYCTDGTCTTCGGSGIAPFQVTTG